MNKIKALALCTPLLVSTALRAQDTFTRVTTGPILNAFATSSAAWTDINNDGYPDLYIGGAFNGGSGSLFLNNRDGTFTHVTSGPTATDVGPSFGAAWGDYDNKGAPGLFVALFGATGTGNWLYHNDGTGSLTKITTGPVVTLPANGNNCAWVDYDNDGLLDLFVANSDQNNFLYHNSGNGSFTRVSNNAIVNAGGNSQGAAWADYDNDGRPDLFVSRVNAPNLLFHNDGGGVFTEKAAAGVSDVIGAGQGVAWADYDNDGYPDLFVINNNAPNLLYHNNGNGTFTRVTTGAIVTDIGNGHGCAWEDYDNDGYLDLIVTNRGGVNFLYHNNGDGTFTRVTTGIVATDSADGWTPAWADYDNDGFPDLLVTQTQGFANRLFHNNGNANNWLNIKCVGTVSNKSAIGAKVRVHATIKGKAMWQMREISGGDGLGTQNDPRARFGLGDATVVDTLRIEWPSGIVQTMANITSKQFLTVTEPSTVVPVFTTQPISVTVTGGAVALDAVATGNASYQWMVNGSTPVAGATNATLLLPDAAAAPGTYTCVATTAGGSATSAPATVTLASTTDIGRLVNISARAQVGTGAGLIVAGFAVGGNGTVGSQSVLIRASGPALAVAPFNVAGTLPDPQLQLFDRVGKILNTNNAWGGTAQISSTATAVGAFSWGNPASHDAALFLPLPVGTYTAQVTGQAGDTGDALAEVYDATPAGAYTLATPRLINLSARVTVGAGPNALFAGFVIKGSTAMTVLIRASGPALVPFNVAGTLPDPQLTLEYQSSGAVIASNAGWGGSPQIAATAAAAGGFGWSSPSSHDSAILITLPPGQYTALTAGTSGDSGVAIVEVYEVR